MLACKACEITVYTVASGSCEAALTKVSLLRAQGP